MLTSKVLDVLENNDITIKKSDNEWMLEWYSNAGENMVEYVEGENDKDFADHFFRLAADFDADEHAEMWVEARGKVAGVPLTIRELIDDADDIQAFLDKVYKELKTSVYED